MRSFDLMVLTALAVPLPAAAQQSEPDPNQSAPPAPIEFYLPDADNPEDGSDDDLDGDGFAPRSVPRRTAGQVLVVLSGLSLLGAVVIGSAQECSPYGCYVHWLFTIPLAVQGGVLGAIGIPLWVSGAGEIPVTNELDSAREQPTVIPEIQIGAGTLGFGVRF